MENVIVNGVDITNFITNFEVYEEMDKSLLIGNAVSTQIKIKLKNKDNQLQELIDYPFIIDDKTYIVYEKPEKWTNIISVTLYDEMILTNVPYDTKLEYPTTLEQQLDEMSSITGVSIDKNSLSKEVLDKVIGWYDNTMLVRNYIAFIAQCDGKNAFIENDKITFIPIAQKTHQTNFCSDYELNEKVNITRVAYDDGIQILAKGDDTGNTLYLSANNGYVDQSDIDRIYDMYNGISFFSFKKFKCREVTTIRLTELIQYHDIIILPLSIKKVVYGGEALNSLDMSGDIALKNIDSIVIKEDLSIKIKRIKVLIDQNEQTMKIIAKEQDELNKKVGSLELSNEQIKSSIQNIETKYENLTPISTDTTYQLSDSGTDIPTGTWLINIPEPIQGKYMWTKTTVTYENGRTNTSYDISYLGKDGQDGTSVTVKNTSVMYATSNDIAEIPNEWNDERPTDIEQGQYLWTKTTVNYSDGKSTTTYAWNYQGIDGSSVDISSQTVEYQVSDDGTKAPTGEWLSDIPQTSAGQYLWTRNITMYSNGLTSTSYSVSYHGLDGDKGEDGTGISSITEEYYLSTSKTSQTGGSWTTTPPTWSSGKYLWTRSKIVYTNPSSTVYTTPICDSSWEAVNEIEIGGRNLLRKSHRTEVTYAYPTSSYLDMFKGVTTVPLNAGTYTLSFWAKSTVDGDKVRVHLYNPSNLTNYTNSQGVTAIAGDGKCDFTLTTKLTKYWVTYTVPKDDSTRSFIVPRVFNGAGSGTLTFKWEKLEEGNKATDWTPAPEDQENIITSDTAPQDTTKMWFDTTSNLLKYWNGESWEVANDYADDLNNTRVEITNEYNSAIEQLKTSITSLVEELQTTTNDNSQAVSRLATQIQQNATSISQVITETNSIVDKLSGLSTKEEISKWARFYGEGTNAVLELGASNSPFAVKLSNTELGFYQNGTRIAYLSNQMLNISQAVVLSKLKFSHFEMSDVEIDGYFHLILK